jgi:hypothetical protein
MNMKALDDIKANLSENMKKASRTYLVTLVEAGSDWQRKIVVDVYGLNILILFHAIMAGAKDMLKVLPDNWNIHTVGSQKLIVQEVSWQFIHELNSNEDVVSLSYMSDGTTLRAFYRGENDYRYYRVAG